MNSASVQRIELVHPGVHAHEGELVHLYYRINRRTGQLVDEPDAYPEPLGEFEVGSVLSCKTADSGETVLRDGIERTRTWHDYRAVQGWIARHDALTKTEETFTCAEPLRAAFHRLDPEGRALLVAQLVRWICQEP